MKHTSCTNLGITLAGVLALTVTAARADSFGGEANAFTIDFVSIGDAGNPVDTGTTGSYFSSYGAVGYAFQMGRYEISRDIIAKANAGGSLGLTLPDLTFAGGNIDTHPATGISWNGAARFVNWLNASQGYAMAYQFAVQPGDAGYTGNENLVLWTSGDAGYDAGNRYRNGNTHYFLPSENEWYKAAFYSGSGTTYSDYATGSDLIPTATTGGTASGSAVYGYPFEQGPADITQAGGLSHYGTMGQDGNVHEWQESAYFAPNDSSSEDRTIRGSSWSNTEQLLRSSSRYSASSSFSNLGVGFRIASVVPEPSCAVLMLGSGLVFLARRRRADGLPSRH